jgi:hypothetical protein
MSRDPIIDHQAEMPRAVCQREVDIFAAELYQALGPGAIVHRASALIYCVRCSVEHVPAGFDAPWPADNVPSIDLKCSECGVVVVRGREN